MFLKKIYKEFIEKILYRKEKIEINQYIKNYKYQKKIIYIDTPEHGNLGDHAIALAIEKLLEDKYENYLILEFSQNVYDRNKQLISKLISSKDIFILIGGGNFGNLYLHHELRRRDVVKRFPNNKIIVMPQSIFFSNDLEGKKELERSISIYSNHNDYNIITRDVKSYEYGKEYFKNNKIYLAPDSVLYLEDYYMNKENKREGVILTLRKDKEKALSDDKIEKIFKYLEQNKIKFLRSDTVRNYDVDRNTRKYEVNNILEEISSSKLNITDRFHGLIFSVITNTPVIVFKSLDHKIEEGIKWFKHLEWVHYVTTTEEVELLIDKYLKNEYNIKKEKYILKEKLRDIFFKI